jgi:hypothetical protein
MNVPLSDGTEYKQSFVKHKLPDNHKQPKEKKVPNKPPAFDGSFAPASRDIGAHPPALKAPSRPLCHVSEGEKQHMLLASANRISDSLPPDLRQAILADSV